MSGTIYRFYGDLLSLFSADYDVLMSTIFLFSQRMVAPILHVPGSQLSGSISGGCWGLQPSM